MRFVHAADLHLDSPLRGLDAYEGAPVETVRGASRRALEALVDLVLADEEIRLLLIAGDVYDGRWQDANTGLFYVGQMQRLADAGRRVVAIRGNHDAESVIARTMPLPRGCRQLRTDAPETVRFDDLGIAVHGQGFAEKAVTADLAAGYPPPVDGLVNVGLLHTSADGRPGHGTYAPCAPDALAAHGYDYWALGHVHAREVLRTDPWIVYSGCLQGRHARETGPKGATIVTVGDGRITDVRPHDLDVVRWERCAVDVGGAASRDDALDRVRDALGTAVEGAGGRHVAARVVLHGRTRAHADLLADGGAGTADDVRAVALEHGGRLWVEKVAVRTTPAVDRTVLLGRTDAIGDVLRDVRDADVDVLAGDEELAVLRRRAPPLRDPEHGLDPTDPATLRGLLPDVERLLLARLGAVGEDA